MVRKRKISLQDNSIESLDDYEDIEDGFCDNYIDNSANAIASFSFVKNEAAGSTPITPKQLLQIEAKKTNSEELVDNRKLQPQPYGITPPIDGEFFEIKRTFVFRRSTVKLLNHLKAEHPDENVYLSTLVDEAIRYYYEYVFSKKEPTS